LITPHQLYEYDVLAAIEREQHIADLEAIEKRADYRATAVMATIMGAMASKKDGSAFTPDDFNFYFRSLMDITDGTEDPSAPRGNEMTTEDSVHYLKTGFGLFVPATMHERVGL